MSVRPSCNRNFPMAIAVRTPTIGMAAPRANPNCILTFRVMTNADCIMKKTTQAVKIAA